MLKIALIGYGAMGRLIKSISHDYNCKVVGVVDQFLGKELNRENLSDSDVVIDFSSKDAVVKNVEFTMAQRKKLVIGTTGWDSDLKNVRQIVNKSNGGAVFGPNFSIGMNVFYDAIAKISSAMNNIPSYDVYGVEKHHTRKTDSPSGTAKVLAEIILDSIDRKSKLTEKPIIDRIIQKDELHFASIRSGDISGEHTIGFESEFDSITLTHSAKNRMGFAIGALKAALFVENRVGFFNFVDEFDRILNQ